MSKTPELGVKWWEENPEMVDKIEEIEKRQDSLETEVDRIEQYTNKARTGLRKDIRLLTEKIESGDAKANRLDKNLSSRMNATEMKLLSLYEHCKRLDQEVHVMKEREQSKSVKNGNEPAESDASGPRRLKRPTQPGSTRKHDRPLYNPPFPGVPEEEAKLGSSLTGLDERFTRLEQQKK
jgi:DNA repair exonuclease SbcCD ATPase subunit